MNKESISQVARVVWLWQNPVKTSDAVLVDQNGNGLTDGIDIGMDGTVDGQISEGGGG